jgi:5-methylthioadenosine/S-adenosylhomocysteine deaminase
MKRRFIIPVLGVLLFVAAASVHASRAGWIESGLYPEQLRDAAIFGGGKGEQVRVYFGVPPYANPGGIGLREGLAEAFDSATVSIRAAFFQINDPSFIDALVRAVSRGVQVQLATDRCYRFKKGYQQELNRLAEAMDRAGQPSQQHLVDDGTESCDQGFNHNKYAVIDHERGPEARSWVGSYNVTAHGAQENFDLAFLIDGQKLADVLKQDHEQLMQGAVQVAKKTVLESDSGLVTLSDAELSQARAEGRKLRYPRITLGSGDRAIEMEVLVSPKSKSLRRIIEEIYAAKKEVLFSTFAIGDAMLVSALINKHGSGMGENRTPVLTRAEPWEKPALEAIRGGARAPAGDPAGIVRDLFATLGSESVNYTIGKDPATARLKTVFNFVYPMGQSGGLVQKVPMLGIFGNKNVGGAGPWERLVSSGVPMLRNTAAGELHNKLFVIDGETLVVGSHNFSQSADNGNDEVTLIIKSAAIGSFVRDRYLLPTRHFTAPSAPVLASDARSYHDYSKAAVLITEVHPSSRSLGPLLGAPRQVDLGEYVELYNAGSAPVNLLGFRISTAFFPLSAGERVRAAQAGGTENELVGYEPPPPGVDLGTPLYDPSRTLVSPGKFALVVGKGFRREHFEEQFREQFQKLQGRTPQPSDYPILLTTGGFFSRGVGGAQGLQPHSRVTLYGLDGFSVIDRFEHPEPEMFQGASIERLSLVPPTRSESARQIRELTYTVVTGRAGGEQREEAASYRFFGFSTPYTNASDWKAGDEAGGSPGTAALAGGVRGPAMAGAAPYGIEGTVVDVDSGAIRRALVVIEDGLISALHELGSGEDRAARKGLSHVVSGRNLIFPGLIDTHNHIKYNYLPLWKTPRDRYSNRNEWPNEAVYANGVKKIYAQVYKDHPACKGDLECEAQARCTAIRYAEIKALAGGTTAIQGSTSFSDETEDFTFRGITSRKPEAQAARPEALLSACLEGGARNIERENFGLADQARTTAKGIDDDLWGFKHLGLPRWPVTAAAKLRSEIDSGATGSFFVHIGEGIDAKSQAEYERLEALGLATARTTVIHGTALDGSQFERMARAGVSLAWSPFSNLLLYGRTTDIPAALRSGVNVSLASDWSLSGSKSLLGELKVADQVNRMLFGGSITDLELVQMVTRNPAQAWGMSTRVGRVLPGMAADLLVIRDSGASNSKKALRALIDAREEDVVLVTVGGRALYGEQSVLAGLAQGREIESLSEQQCGSASKALSLDYASGERTLAGISAALASRMATSADSLPEKVKASLGAEFFKIDPVCEAQDSRYRQSFETLSSGRLIR